MKTYIYFVLRQIAEMLHEKGIDPLVQDNYGATALIYACAQQVTALGEFILSKTGPYVFCCCLSLTVTCLVNVMIV